MRRGEAATTITIQPSVHEDLKTFRDDHDHNSMNNAVIDLLENTES